MHDLRAAVAVGEEAGGALVGPFHRPAQHLRRVRDAGIFGIVHVLHAERAADIGGQDANLVVRHVQDFRERDLVAGHALGRHLHRKALAGLVVGRQRHAWLHRHHGDAGVDDIDLGHMRGCGKRRIDPGGIAIVIVERGVVGDVVIELRRARLCRFLGIGHGRERLDVEFDGLCGIARLRQRFGDHEGHGIADKAHFVRRQRHPVGLQQRRAIAALQRQAAGEGVVAGRYEVLSRPHPEHARHGAGGLGIDAADDAVGVAGADDEGIGLPRQAEIVGVLALAADQRVVFLAPDRLSDPVFLQCDSVFQRRRRRVILHRKIPEMPWISADWRA